MEGCYLIGCTAARPHYTCSTSPPLQQNAHIENGQPKAGPITQSSALVEQAVLWQRVEMNTMRRNSPKTIQTVTWGSTAHCPATATGCSGFLESTTVGLGAWQLVSP